MIDARHDNSIAAMSLARSQRWLKDKNDVPPFTPSEARHHASAFIANNTKANLVRLLAETYIALQEAVRAFIDDVDDALRDDPGASDAYMRVGARFLRSHDNSLREFCALAAADNPKENDARIDA